LANTIAIQSLNNTLRSYHDICLLVIVISIDVRNVIQHSTTKKIFWNIKIMQNFEERDPAGNSVVMIKILFNFKLNLDNNLSIPYLHILVENEFPS
jgi:hypothetical protein